MSKRNFILLIVVLLIVGVAVLFLYLSKPAGTTNTKPTESGTNFVSEFFNIISNNKKTTTGDEEGEGGVVDVSENTTENNTDGSGVETPKLQLKKVSSMPIAGFGVFKKERFKVVSNSQPVVGQQHTNNPKPTAPVTEFITSLRYVEKKSGNVFQTFADNIDERKFSDTLIPNVEEAYFNASAESVVIRYYKKTERAIATFLGTLPKETLGADTGTNELIGSFLPDNITDLSVSPDRTKIFYVYGVGNGVAGITSSFTGAGKVQVFDSAFSEWLSVWPNNDLITVTTKPSGLVEGFMYTINPSKKDLNKILGNIYGLTTLTSPDGKLVLYSNNNLSMYIYNIDTGEVKKLDLNTLPEKCVWGKNSITLYCAVPKSTESNMIYPDSWYQGIAVFKDNIFKIDTSNNTSILLVDPFAITGDSELDITKPTLDNEEKYLFFVNKSDSYLWKLELR